VNLLAHAVLSPNDRLIRVGNVVADFVHRNEREQLSEGLQKGVRLHLRIDQFTDNHEVVQISKERLIGFQRFGNPLVDVFYDHFLVRHWKQEEPVEDYIEALYKDLVAEIPNLPFNAAQVIRRLLDDDWLNSYDNFDGLERALTRMERRLEWGTGREVNLLDSLQILRSEYKAFEQDFQQFWPHLQRDSKEFVRTELGRDDSAS
jgi:acyl carrier protein phosphodiesterase